MAVQLTTTLSERPTDAPPGTLLLETDTNRMIVWDGSAWQLYLPDGVQSPGFDNNRSVYVQSTFAPNSNAKFFQLATPTGSSSLQQDVHTLSMSLWFCFHENSNTGNETGGYIFTTANTGEVDHATNYGANGMPRNYLLVESESLTLTMQIDASKAFGFSFMNPTGTTLVDGNWHHVVIVSEINTTFKANGTQPSMFQMKCWIDGAQAPIPGSFSNDTGITGFSDTTAHGISIPLGTDNKPMYDSNDSFDTTSGLTGSVQWKLPTDNYTRYAHHDVSSLGAQNALMGGGPATFSRDRFVFGMPPSSSPDTTSKNNFGIWIDEIAIWETALTSSEVASIYSGGAAINLQAGSANYQSHADLKHWWRMGDDETSTPSVDTVVTGVRDSVTSTNCVIRTYDQNSNDPQLSGYPQITGPIFTDFSVKGDGTTGTTPDAETEYEGI